MLATATGGLTSLWFLTRGAGATTLVLLTVVIALGVANIRGFAPTGQPRIVLQALHRNGSLLALVFLATHVISAVVDPFAPIQLIDAVLPFVSAYRAVWLGLGALALDLLAAVILTSLWRRQLGYLAWRWTHWAAYACWPIALVHGLGTGSDARSQSMLTLTVACVALVVAAACWRALDGWPSHPAPRVGGMLASGALPLFLILWLPGGPLGRDWAQRAGTPPASSAPAARITPPATAPGPPGPRTTPTPSVPGGFRAPVQGTLGQRVNGAGNAVIHIVMTVGAAQQLSQLHVLITGRAIPGGGVQMTRGSLTLGTAADPHLYTGPITALSGAQIAGVVAAPSGRRYALVMALAIAPGQSAVSGTVIATAER